MNPIQMTAQLYEARETAKGLLGAQYPEKMAELAAAIDSVAAGKGIERIAAMTLMAKHAMEADAPITALYVMAALVELVEPEPTNG